LAGLVTSIATDLSTRHEESLLGWLKSRQIPVVLVRWPVHPVYARVIRKDAKYCRFEPALTQLARRYQVRLVDFQQVEPKPQPTDFFNLDHMTRQAGERYTQRLAETISK
jgi:hypothetical protein